MCHYFAIKKIGISLTAIDCSVEIILNLVLLFSFCLARRACQTQIVDCNNNIFHRKIRLDPVTCRIHVIFYNSFFTTKLKQFEITSLFCVCFFSYNNATGEFTVPSGGDGLYFFYINFFADDTKITDFVVRLNRVTDLCYARADMNSGGVADNGTPTCGAVATVSAGNR